MKVSEKLIDIGEMAYNDHFMAKIIEKRSAYWWMRRQISGELWTSEYAPCVAAYDEKIEELQKMLIEGGCKTMSFADDMIGSFMVLKGKLNNN